LHNGGVGFPRRLLLVAAALAALFGCGDDAKEVSPDRLVKAAQTTSAAGSARFEMRGETEVVLQRFEFSGDGVMDSGSQKGRMNIDMSDIGEATGQDAEDWKGEQIIDGFVVYMRIPAVSEAVGSSTPWLKIDLEKASQMQGLDIGQFSQMNQNDPTQMLHFLRAVSGKVEELGSDEVAGVETTHYRATVDLRRYPDTLPPARREAARESAERLIEQLGSSTIPSEVWIDGDDLVRRMRTKFDMKVPTGTGGKVRVGLDLTVDLLEFGVEGGDFSPPPADQVTDLLELQGAGSSTF
jgi:hypothetical protein